MRRQFILSDNGCMTLVLAFALAGILVLAGSATAQPSGLAAAPNAGYLTREDAVRYALQNNAYLMTARQQYGFGQAAIISARTYPFNPIYGGIVAHDSGPDVTNRVFNEHYVTLELELCGQGGYRRAAASATASRIEWEIAQQEMSVSIAVIRAYNTVLYRQKKLEALEETINLNEQVAQHVRRLFDAGKMKALDLMLAGTELDNTRAQRGQAKTTLAVARSELRKLLGTPEDSFVVFGNLDVSPPTTDQTALTQLALNQRPDLRARQLAVAEAQAGLKLVQSNRFGNPSFGPFFEYDSSRVVIVGARASIPLPCLNVHRGEILKAETDVAKVHSEVYQLEVQASLDVQAALHRFVDAKKWVADYEKNVVPNLQNAKQEVEKLFATNDPSVDLSRLLLLSRAYLKANETLLDARYEVSQAEADLALAVAEPGLAMGPAQLPPGNLVPVVSNYGPAIPATRVHLGLPVDLPKTLKN